jgi:hypothetical protein
MSAFRYPEVAAHGGRLEYHGPIPVLTVEGDAAAIGQQVGKLALTPAQRLLDYPLDYIRSQVKLPLLPRLIWWLLKSKCRRLYQNIPAVYRIEIEACAAACPDRGRLVSANTLFDMGHISILPQFGCSGFVVPPQRSATSGMLFGRNLDFFPLGYLNEFSLVMLYRPAVGRLGFLSIGFPGVVGCFSGMNAAGLCLARNEVLAPSLKHRYEPSGVPFAIALRQVLETCQTTAEAHELLVGIRHATVNIVLLADTKTARVLELTPDGVFERPMAGDFIGCSNHFLHPELANPNQPNSYHTQDRQTRLQQCADAATPMMSRENVWTALGQVHQGELTLQSMIFEPSTRTVHAAFGTGPTTDHAPTAISLADLLG